MGESSLLGKSWPWLLFHVFSFSKKDALWMGDFRGMGLALP